MTTAWRLTVVFLIVQAAVLATGNTALAQKKPLKSSLPFSVKYRIAFVRHPESCCSPFDRINNAGIAIRASYWEAGHLFHIESGTTCWDVRELIREEDRGLVPEEAVFSTNGISNNGKVTGTMWWPDMGMGWAYVLDTQNNLQPGGSSFRLVDDTRLPSADRTRGYAVNDFGDVLGLYRDSVTETFHLFICYSDVGLEPHLFDYLPTCNPTDAREYPQLNNFGQVVATLTVGGAFRYTFWHEPALEFFPDIDKNFETVSGLNNNGVFCGMIYSGKPNLPKLTPFRCYDTDGEDTPIPIAFGNSEQAYYSAVRINSECDLLVRPQGGEPSIFHENSQYLFPVESLIDVSNLSSEDLALWKSRETLRVNDMTDRYPDAGAPQSLGRLCGCLTYYEGHWTKPDSFRAVGFVLTPQYE